MQKEGRKQIADFLKDKKKRSRMYALLAVFSVAVVSSVYAALCMPAISMAQSQPILEAERVSAVYEDTLSFRVTAEAPEGEKPSVFVLHTMSNGGGLLDQYEFDDQEVCSLETEDGTFLDLHREREAEGETNYWFELDPGAAAAFRLDCASNSWTAPDGEPEQQPEQLPGPVGPGGGGTVETPETPDIPDIPETPEEPDTPDLPDTPETGDPETGEPGAPDPGDPGENPPVAPEKPEPPTESETPNLPDTPEVPETPPAADPSEPSHEEPKPDPKPETPAEAPVSKPEGLLSSIFLPAYALDEETADEVLGGGSGSGEAEPPSGDETGEPETPPAQDDPAPPDASDSKPAETPDPGHGENPGEGGGELPDGELPDGELPDGELPDGELPDGELPDGELPDGELPDGELPDGELPDGELPDGELPDDDFLAGDGEDQFLTVSGGFGDHYNSALRAAKWNDAAVELTWREELEERTLTVKTESGVEITMTGREDVFPGGVKGLSLTAEELIAPDFETLQAEAELDPVTAAFRAVERATDKNFIDQRLFDIKLLRDGQEVEPLDSVSVTFSGLTEDAGGLNALVHHVEDGAEEATEMDSQLLQDGDVVMDTDHFSAYMVSFYSAADGLTLDEILSGLGTANQYAVFANHMDAGGHMEGSIAVKALNLTQDDTFTIGNGGSKIDGIGGGTDKVNLTVTKEIMGTAPAGTIYTFGIYQGGKEITQVTITGAGSATAKDLPAGNYQVYELDKAGNKIADDGQGDGFTVTYDAANLGGYLGSLNNTSQIETFVHSNFAKMKVDGVGALLVGKDCKIRLSGEGLNGNEAEITSSNGYAVILQNVPSGALRQPTTIDWGAEFSSLEQLSMTLAKCETPVDNGSAPGVSYQNIKVPESGQIQGELNFTLGEEQYLVVNLDCSEVPTGSPVVLPKILVNSKSANWNPEFCRLLLNLHSSGECYTGTIQMGSEMVGTILAPKGTVEQYQNFGGSIIADTVKRSSQEIHQHSFRPHGAAETTVTNTYPEAGGLELVLHKVGADDEALNGVTFELYTANDAWDQEKHVATQTTAAVGTAAFPNLKPGNYLLVETSTAEGYMLPAEPWRIVVSEAEIHFLDAGVQPASEGNAQISAPSEDSGMEADALLPGDEPGPGEAELLTADRIFYEAGEAETAADAAGAVSFGFLITNEKLTDKTSVTVTKKWAGDVGAETDRPDSVTVHLAANGTQIGAGAVLSGKNEWTHTWQDLSTADENGAKIVYTVEEDDVPGYDGIVTENKSSAAEGGWKSVEGFTVGKTYMLVANGGSKALTSNGTNTWNLGEADVGGNINDGTRPAETALWTFTANSKLVNQSNNRYLARHTYNNNYYITALKSGGNNAIRTGGQAGGAWLSVGGRYLYGIYDGYAGASSRYATRFTLYEWQGGSVNNLSFTITNTKSGEAAPEDVHFEHRKTIDAFRDGADNPDTTLDKTAADPTDLYRLYLDITGKQEPIDLLIVVDQSGSMGVFSDMKVNGSAVNRATAVRHLLNGRTTPTNKPENLANGFIAQFLASNPDNQVAVSTFEGRMDISTSAGKGYSYEKDSQILLDWTKNASYVNVQSQADNGTNYEAGLLRATEMFGKIKSSPNKKIMIFLSDGVPTLYIQDNGSRWGNGNYTDSDANAAKCKDPSKGAFTDFRNSAENKDVTVFTIGISENITAEKPGTSQSPDVLKDMADRGGGTFIGVKDTDALNEALKRILYPTNVVVTDRLSQYVEWYGQQPDVKLTMTNRKTQEVTTLWQGIGSSNSGTATKDNHALQDGVEIPIVQSVTYMPTAAGKETTGTVQAVFNPAYTLSPDYTYTLSFNVQATQTAYEEFARSGYGDVEGDAETDYGDNETSSEQPGFRSNHDAKVAYVTRGRSYHEEYDHPVIQVSDCGLTLWKTDLTGDRSLAGAEFDLYRASGDGVKIPGAEGAYGVLTAHISTGKDGRVTISNLPAGSEWYLAETRAPTGYQLLEHPVHFQLTRDEVTVLSDSGMASGGTPEAGGPPVLEVKNTDGYDLPSTGGIGTRMFTGMGLLLMAAATTLLLIRRREGGAG